MRWLSDANQAIPANDLVLQLISTIREHLCDARRGEKMRSGANLAIVGLPNAGKSRLMNHLADRKVAIVSAVPGTTRDVVEVLFLMTSMTPPLIAAAATALE